MIEIDDGYSINNKDDMGDIRNIDGFTWALLRSLRFI